MIALAALVAYVLGLATGIGFWGAFTQWRYNQRLRRQNAILRADPRYFSEVRWSDEDPSLRIGPKNPEHN
jgi:hypothetical protein